MLEVKGKYNTATIYTDNIEEAAYSQVLNLMNQKFAEGSKFAIMPDCHAGAGCVIGLTMKVVDKVVPNLVGVDIGCGMLVVKVDRSFKFDLEKVDRRWHEDIPSGMNWRTKKHEFADRAKIEDILAPVNVEKLKFSVGTLGGGNHFGEIDVDDDGAHYIVIHSGSRHLGIEVCKHYQRMAIEYHKGKKKSDISVIERLKKEGRQSEIEAVLKANKEALPSIPDELAYLEGQQLEDYLHDMKIAQEYAVWNREAMLDVLLHGLGIGRDKILEKFCTIHNYIDIDNRILRKGAISLQKDETAIIPMNMRDGSIIVRGKGNPEWNFSGPHGAGRLMSRSKAKESLSVDDFRQSMDGIFTTCVGKSTIDESPMAYKPMDEIIRNIQDTAVIVKIIKPVYNFKAAE
jgi:RNA-splicing ligase RtcB